MYGGTTREDPEDPRILSIPDTVSVRGYVWGDNSGGSQVSRDTCVRGYVWGHNSGGSRHCVCEGVCMGAQLGRIPSIPGYLVFQTHCL